eukprot:scaffold200382_cov21-Tisochrysis_lutea.AAC.2
MDCDRQEQMGEDAGRATSNPLGTLVPFKQQRCLSAQSCQGAPCMPACTHFRANIRTRIRRIEHSYPPSCHGHGLRQQLPM